MSKIIVSAIKAFPGEVVLYDPIPMPRVLEWETGINAGVNAVMEAGDGKIPRSLIQNLHLPGICACVEEWRLENPNRRVVVPLDGFEQLTPETFPGTPKTASAKLIAWLTLEIGTIYSGEGVPNE